jgi:CPA2 family monovalent cation:H+ antiporter-2
MPHSVSLISTIAAAFALALVFGFLAVRLKLPALLGYLVAGVVLGPFTPGFTADVNLTQQLAEIGVMLLMFGVGLHLSVADLLAVRRMAIPGALLRILIATPLGIGAGLMWGWSFGASLVLGVSLSVASTVVLLRALEQRGSMDSLSGRIAVGWLVVEDLAMVVVLVLLPPLAATLGGVAPAAPAGTDSLALTLLLTLGGVAALIVLMLVVGRRLLPWLLWQVARTGSRELFTLCVVATAVGIAYGSGKLFGVSFALGAFLAGLVMRESEFSHRAAEDSLPFRDAFSVLFFVSVGMLFDPSLLWREWDKVLVVLAIVVAARAVVTFGLVLAYRYPLNTALTVGAGLSQIGEFSFILAAMGVQLGVLPAEGQNLIIAGAVISIAINPLVFSAIEPARRWILSRSRLAQVMARRADRLAELPHSFTTEWLTGHVLLVGYGRVGRRISDALVAAEIPVVVVEQNRDLVEGLRARGRAAVAGDAAVDPAVLIQAHVVRAKVLVIATPDTVGVRAMTATARKLRPDLPVIVRTHSDDEAELLRSERIGEIFMGEHELALSMTRAVLARVRPPHGTSA